MSKVAWIGLGVMGFPMAGHLKTRGRPRRHRVQPHPRQGRGLGRAVRRTDRRRRPAEAAEGADFVFTCVGNDDDLRAVTLGPDGAFASTRHRAPSLIDHTTASATIARELHAAASGRGASALDAPVSGGQSGAENGTLTVMAGGDATPFAGPRP